MFNWSINFVAIQSSLKSPEKSLANGWNSLGYKKTGGIIVGKIYVK